MANFKYKTRGNSSPQGKPRVYFCCHPEDFNKYFESISDEILTKQNCAIWYNDETIVRDKEFFADLKQMQLFVMPVTTNLLCTENEALHTEFKFAIENHIPVLPLMQESGLEELFNKKCGDLQFLYKNNTDATAISYDEKLKKYLESVLIGDELAEKIRAAFDAYVFLSYRKKDRRYAQELMRLIHKNEFCRDIAIWYDEFLTPGENFNDSIKEALQKSGLFVLTVTPNLINEPNYIMTTEYPMAKQEGKPVLPAELVPTDRKELSEKYEDIPKPADAHNEAELSEALLESIKKMAIKENDNSPEHNFLIALAYLGGVDVEVDCNKALLLLESAANAGLIESMAKLVHMYQNGQGVQRDPLIAIAWQSNLVGKLKGRYEHSRSTEDFCQYQHECVNLGDLYCQTGFLRKAEETYNTVLTNCDLLDDTAITKVYLSWAYEKMGQVHKDMGDITKAKFYFIKNLEIEYEYLDLDESEDVLSLALSCSKLGELTDDIAYCVKAIDLFERIKEQPDENLQESIWVTGAHIYNALGNAYRANGQINKSLPQYQEAVKFSELLLTENYNPARDKHNYLATLCNLADVFEYAKRYDESVSLYEQCLELAEELVKEYEEIDDKLALALCHRNLVNATSFAVNLSDVEKNNLSMRHHMQSAAILEQLIHQGVETIHCYSQLAITYSAIAYAYRLECNEEEASAYFNKALTICEKNDGNEHFEGFASEIKKQLRKKQKLQWKIIFALNKLNEKLDLWLQKLENKEEQ